MAIVTKQELHRYMSEPRWSEAQWKVAEDTLAGVESDLEAALMGARITPVEVVEAAAVARDGRVLTSLPVNRLLAIGAVELDEDDPLPDGYRLDANTGRLWSANVLIVAGVRAGWPWVASAGAGGMGTEALRYMGGWGAQPSLKDAILRKAQARMGPRHEDSMNVSGVTATPTPTINRDETFTDADLKSLGRYRNLGWGV